MKISKFLSLILLFTLVASPLFSGVSKVAAQSSQTIPVNLSQQVQAAAPNDEIGQANATGQMRTTTMAMRIAAALHLNIPHYNSNVTYAGINPDTAQYSPLANVGDAASTMATNLAAPDYFGVPNWANSPLPTIGAGGSVTGGIKKFQDALPVFCPTVNSLGQCIPLAVADTTTFPGSDYYEIAVVEYREQMSSSLPAVTATTGTKLRGYVQVVPFNTGVPLFYVDGVTPILDKNGQQVNGATKPHYLGPMIVATGCSLVANPTTCKPRPVRVKFDNYLPTGPAGNLFLPTDVTYMGAGMGPGGSILGVTVPKGGTGTGYTSAPSVSFVGGGGTGAAATATVINNKVTAVTVTNGGSSFAALPTVSFSGGGGSGASASAVWAGPPDTMYSQNRATLHLHGGNTPWISDGTTHQWTTPAGESTYTAYSKGDSVAYVPDMWFDANGNLLPVSSGCQGQVTCTVAGSSNDPGLGSLSFYWTNQQSGRLLFYHDHAYGTTRLDVYGGEAAGYLIADPTEEFLLANAGVPGTTGGTSGTSTTSPDLAHLIPLIIQDKTFVPDPTTQLLTSDPTWDTTAYGGLGNLWFPHVYIPNQNPADVTGSNAFGRWDYGPWFWPPQDPSSFPLANQPYPCTSLGTPAGGWAFPPLMCPGTPNPSGTPEAFMDTPVINGTAYPTLTVDPTSYRFQMLMAGNDRTWNLGLYQAEPLSIAVIDGGSGYTITPTVTLNGVVGGGVGAVVTAEMSHGSVTSIVLTNVGSGYTVAPGVSIGVPNNPGIQATATASVDPVTHTLLGIKITNPGSGYSSAPIVTIASGGATANAFVTAPGVVVGVKVINPGATPWTVAPTVGFGGTSTTTATAVASVNSEVKMVPAVPHDAASAVPLCDQANPTSGAMLVTAITDTLTSNPLNGTGLPAGCWPAQWPTDGRDGGVPDPLTAGPAFIQIGSESGLLPKPVMIPSTPVGYEYNRRSITVLNIFTHGLLLGPAERADVIVDFSQYAGQTLLLYNDAPAPVPAFDSRTDYYTGDPDQSMAGGAPSTLPGYGPNTRTIMQIKVNAVSGTGTNPINMLKVGPAVSGAFNTQQNPIIVPEPTFVPGGNGYAANFTYSRISDTSLSGWFNGQVGSITLNGGSGYAFPPTFVIAPPSTPGGTNATAQLTFTGASVSIALGAHGSGYTSTPSVVISAPIAGGTRATASATITRVVNTINVTNGGNSYTSAPAVSFQGGGGTGAAATANVAGGRVTSVTVTNGGSGYASAPNVRFTGGGGNGASATATTTRVVNNLVLTNAGTGYTANPTVTFTGGGCVAPNCATATGTYVPGKVASLIITNPGTGYTSAPAITFTTVGPAPVTAATAVANPPAIPFGPKAIQELFTLDYGRMNATLGVEIPFTNFFVQTTIPYGYVDPPTEMFQSGDTIFWKITHNGVDTHFIHFHLYDVQVINRVGWDGMIKPPDANEMAWKDTVRMNPLEDIIVAMRPMKQILPAAWQVPNSYRPLDVTQSIGASNTNNVAGFANIDPNNNPAPVTNDVTNFGWEYVVHCHILGHEENDMMRAQLLAVPPLPVTNVTATRQGNGNNQRVLITWRDGSTNETGFTVQRATNANGPWLSLSAPAPAAPSPTAPAAPGVGTQMSFTDTTISRRTTYYYQVVANNVVGYTALYGPGIGYPTLSADSAPVAPAAPITTQADDQPGPIFADSFETGLNLWSGVVGSVDISPDAVIGPNGGKYGMVATIGPNGEPAYVLDILPVTETMYDGNFYFNPNHAVTAGPVDIFVGFDQNGQPVFGVQYQYLDANSFELRAWAMKADGPEYSDWDVFAPEPGEDNPLVLTHKIEVAWASSVSGGLSFYVDDQLFRSLSADTSASQLAEVLLGPSMGLSAGDSGSMYFDEFTSSRVAGLSYVSWLPVLTR